METVRKVMNSYSVYPNYITKVTDRLFRIQDGQGDYALKKSLLTRETVAGWENAYHLAASQNLRSVLPVYLTHKGNLHVEMDGSIYYLTPWVQTDERQDKKEYIKGLFHGLGDIHANTKRSESIDKDEVWNSFDTYKEYCIGLQQDLLSFVERFENNRYMSPVELLVCTHFKELEAACFLGAKRTEQLMEKGRQDRRWNWSLCHGNLRMSHTLQTAADPFLINWENTMYDNAVRDLSGLFSRETIYHNHSGSLFMELFPEYMEKNKLTTTELYLLIIHLVNPSSYLKLIRMYTAEDGPLMDHIPSLQQNYRRILFGLEFSRYIEEEYESFSFNENGN
ncbi:hypothetical protein [Virgibacillus sediminis]|uniref:Spore coat protein YsxE n=1 Tax=Virgibacillus sediminis TaxID=202260 RepID=A0ABV7A6C5_9BACI